MTFFIFSSGLADKKVGVIVAVKPNKKTAVKLLNNASFNPADLLNVCFLIFITQFTLHDLGHYILLSIQEMPLFKDSNAALGEAKLKGEP